MNRTPARPPRPRRALFDPIHLEVAEHRFAALAEEMGEALVRSAVSPNIKERRDLSCGVFDRAGRLIAHAAHIPVHLGAMPASVAAAIHDCPPRRGDVVMLNDPYRGGTHLPDITVVAPVFLPDDGDERPSFYVANRAHHADVGGMVSGSMPFSTEIHQEGLIIPPLRIARGGQVDEALLALILANVRNPAEREWDLRAQIAVLAVAGGRLLELAREVGGEPLRRSGRDLLAYAETMMRVAIREIPDGEAAAADVLEPVGGATPRLCTRVAVAGETARIDFTGTSPAVRGPINAVRAVTLSACCYVFRCLLREAVPANAGILQPLELVTVPGTLVDARPPSAVAAGNVETSQRIVDVLLRALAELLPDRIPAASAGTMMNVSMGGTGASGAPFTYYETVAGGAGAGPSGPGASAIQTHMTNTLNTPVEALVHELPVRLLRHRVRRGSGGNGRWRGGDGIERVFEVERPATLSLLCERLTSAPYGLAGGEAGRPAEVRVERRDGTSRPLRARAQVELGAGDRIWIVTPGGGGWGAPAAGRADAGGEDGERGAAGARGAGTIARQDSDGRRR